jgi:drug/metabolite transporter (DMT)-like permease
MLPFALAGPPAARLAAGLLWGGAAGLAGGAAVLVFYRTLATSPMSVVAPLTAVTSAVVPAVTGIALGDRPPVAAYLGMVLGAAAVALVSRGEEHGVADQRRAAIGRRGVLMALLAGAGFGVYFILFARAPHDSGLWPLVAGRFSGLLLFVALGATTVARVRRSAGSRSWLIGRWLGTRPLVLALIAGTLDALANLAYLLAVRGGLLSVVAVITSLYPASTVLLARIVFHERMALVQRIGLGAAAGAVTLLALR